MSYCVSCGAEIEDGKQLCDSCEAEKESTKGKEQGEKQTSAKKPEQSFQYYIDLYKSLLLSPNKPLKDAIHSKNVIASAITVGVTTLYFSLISLYFMRYFYYFITGGFGGLGGFGGYSFPYGTVFFKSFFLFALQWPLFALALFLMVKLFKYEISFVQSLNITGIAYFYLLVIGIAATIFGFISLSIGLVLFIGGFFTTAFAVYIGIQPLLENKNPLEVYLMPAVILAFLFVQGILVQMF